MKLVDIYLSYKKKYREYVVLIKSGIFYEVIEDDIGIMYSLFGSPKLSGKNKWKSSEIEWGLE